MLSSQHCDVLVLDFNLPGENGFSTAHRLFDPLHPGNTMLTVGDHIGDWTRGCPLVRTATKGSNPSIRASWPQAVKRFAGA
ncbi:MAG: hypothetical protein U1E02_42140 [Hydrogenophaga sp.]|nr:hypothetical protein [Hydrogenophaga sp.]